MNMKKWMMALVMCSMIGIPAMAQDKEPAKEEKKTEAEGEKKEGEKKEGEEGRKATAEDLKSNYQKPYKTKGNTWTHKSVSKYGETDMVTYMKYEITEVGEKSAKYKLTMMDAEKKETFSMADQEFEFYEETPEEKPAEGAEPVEIDAWVVKIKVEAGEFETILWKYGEGKDVSKTYIHKELGLIVKSESSGEGYSNTMELIEMKVQ
jgi:hypothetical protein